MAGGWLPFSAQASQLNTKTEEWPVGDERTWSVTVPRDLTGYTAEWRLGIPINGAVPTLSSTGYAPPEIIVRKTSAANLAMNPVSLGVWSLNWAVLEADTIGLLPGIYCHQAVVIGPASGPVTVDEGFVRLGPSLRATDLQPV